MNILKHDDCNYLIEEALTTKLPERLHNLLELAKKYNERQTILQAIMTNPNTPQEILFELGADFPQELLEHPIFNLLLLENIFDLVMTMPHKTRVSLVEFNNTPFSILKIIIQYSRQDIPLERVHNLKISVGTLEILAHDTDKFARRFVGYNSNTPASLLEILAYDTDELVRQSVAENSNTPARLLEILAYDTEVDVRRFVAENSNTPASLLEILAYDTEVDVRRIVAWNCNTQINLLEILAYDTEIDVRRIVAQNLYTPLNLLEILAQDTDEDVRHNAECNLNFQS